MIPGKIYRVARGQVSLELIVLILAGILGAIIVGVVMSDNLINTTCVESTREIIFRGFI